MSETNTFEELAEVIRDELDLDELQLMPSMAAADIEGWDSLAHVLLIFQIEKAFAIRFTTSEIESFKTADLGALSEAIAHHRL